jgi:hypothetical protein
MTMTEEEIQAARREMLSSAAKCNESERAFEDHLRKIADEFECDQRANAEANAEAMRTILTSRGMTSVDEVVDEWVKILGLFGQEVSEAASWIDAGWTDPQDVDDILTFGPSKEDLFEIELFASPDRTFSDEQLAKLGVTAQELQAYRLKK